LNIVNGFSPPYVYLPLIGSKKLLIGPSLVNPDVLNVYTDPKYWIRLTSRQVLYIRRSGKALFKPVDPQIDINESSVTKLREISLYSGNVEVELEYIKRRPNAIFDPYEGVTLNGGELGRIIHYTGGVADRRIEKVYEDKDLLAKDAVLYLHNSGLSVYKIQQLLSVGALGTKRKLVATRWSITAVDSIISSRLIDEIKNYPELNEHYLGESYVVGNRIIVMMFPGKFYYEMMESWGPYFGNRNPKVAMDYEGFLGRTNYAEEVEGAYYAARYSVAKYLKERMRQAKVVVLLEVDRNWIPNLGVWRVREGTEIALKNLKKFEDENAMIDYAFSKTYTLRKSWLSSSFLLRQKSLESFF